MELERIDIEKLGDKKVLDSSLKEAYKYGKGRGIASAVGDRYAILGGPGFDNVIKDYLAGKFQVRKDLLSIAEALPRIPNKLIERLKKGFDEGYQSFRDED